MVSTKTVIASLVFMLTVVFSVDSAFAAEFESDTRYIYQRTHMNSMNPNNPELTKILKSSTLMMVDYVQNLKNAGLFGTDLSEFKQIKDIGKKDLNISNALDTMNTFMDSQRSRNRVGVSKETFYPDIYMPIVGVKMALPSQWRFSVGSGFVFGMPIAKYHVNKIEISTGKIVDSYYEYDAKLVVMVSPDLKFKSTGQAKVRLGLGAFWASNKRFTGIEDLYGMGGGISSTRGFAVAGNSNVKTGYIFGGKSDFTYAVMSKEVGVQGTPDPFHFNGVGILPMETVLKLFSKAQAKAFSDFSKSLLKQFTKTARGQLDGTNGDSKGSNKDDVSVGLPFTPSVDKQ